MVRQAESLVEHLKNEQLPCRVLMLDNDSKYSMPFTEAIEKAEIRTQRTAIQSPNTIAYIERIVRTIKQDVLHYFVVIVHKQMDDLCDQFRVHYHLERPHQGLDNQLIEKPTQNENTTGESIPIAKLRCQERHGDLLNRYSRKAA